MEIGILVEPEDIEQLAKTIVWLLTDEALKNRLAENAYSQTQQFSWDRVAEDFTTVIKGVLNG